MGKCYHNPSISDAVMEAITYNRNNLKSINIAAYYLTYNDIEILQPCIP